MKTTCRMNTIHFAAALFTAIVCGAALSYTLPRGEYLASAVCFAVCVLFACIAVRDGSVVSVSPAGVQVLRLGKCVKSLSWADIAEVGIVGTDVFRKGKASRNKFVYFSKKALTEDECFRMCLEWPPKEQIYFRFDYSRIGAVQSNWNGELRMYNADDVIL